MKKTDQLGVFIIVYFNIQKITRALHVKIHKSTMRPLHYCADNTLGGIISSIFYFPTATDGMCG